MALDSGLGGECGEGDPNLWEQTDYGLPEPKQMGHWQVKVALLGAPGTTLFAAEARVCRARRGLWVGSPCTLATCQQVRLQH